MHGVTMKFIKDCGVNFKELRNHRLQDYDNAEL